MQESQRAEITTSMTVGLAAFGAVVGGGVTAWLMTWVSGLLDLDNRRVQPRTSKVSSEPLALPVWLLVSPEAVGWHFERGNTQKRSKSP